MNILPKKSWHVRTKANIERVRRDEAKAAEEEKEKQRRIAVAEQEARTALLRQKAQQRTLTSGSGETSSSVSQVDKPEESSADDKKVELFQEGKHINFWSEFEQGKPTASGNEEYEKEKKDEKEKHEQSIGLLTYLGQSSAERLATKPWYQMPKESQKRGNASETSNTKSEEEADRKRKRMHDPMGKMIDYLEVKRKIEDQGNPDAKHRKKKHKHKHSHKEHKKSSSSKTLEQLRAERLQREKGEKARTEALMARLRGEVPEAEKEAETQLDERQRRYNSQFNPDFVRKPRHKQSHR